MDMEPTAEDVAEFINTAGGIDNPIIKRQGKQGETMSKDEVYENGKVLWIQDDREYLYLAYRYNGHYVISDIDSDVMNRSQFDSWLRDNNAFAY